MRIAFITSGTIKSSLSYRALAMAKELVKKGHDVYILTPRFDKYSQFKDEEVNEIEGVKIIKPLQIKTFLFELGLIPYIISTILVLFKLKPNIIHVSKTNPITVGSLLLKFIKNIPVIVDVDDLDSEVMKIEKSPLIKIMLVQLSEKLLLRYSTGIIAASKFLQDIYSYQYRHKYVAYIPNGAEFINMNKIILKKVSQNRIVFIGNINRITILEPLFYAVKKLTEEKIDISVRIIGSGLYLNYFKDLARKLGLNKIIIFLGYIERENLGKYIATGDIGYCYMPNEITIRACSSMKVFQYMQFGAIPVVSNVGDLPLYTFNGKAGYIANSDDINSLIRILKEALIDKSTRQEKLDFVYRNVESKYKWSVLASKLEHIYKKYYD